MHKCKRVVMTSSIASCRYVKDQKQTTFSSKDWTDLTIKQTAYVKSKCMAEKAAWEFLEKLPETERFDLVCINPGFILGPSLVTGHFASADFITNLMSGKYSKVPHVKQSTVDVRNVAQAHL